MASAGSPTVRRRRLAAELKRLRGNRTGGEVARGVGWSATKVSRAETGRESLPPAEIEKLIDFYGVTNPLRAGLLELAEDAAKRGWWDEYSETLSPEYMEFIGLEAEASLCDHWQSDVVPGLLQTAGYAQQLDEAFQSVDPTRPPMTRERFLQVRLRRQQRLIREPLLYLQAVVDEAVLLRGVGDRDVMRTQLARLAEASEMPNVDLRVLPLDRKLALGAVPSFAILSFGAAGEADAASLSDVVQTEALHAYLYVEGDANMHLYRLFFDAITKTALPPTESRDLIVTTMRRVWE